MGQPYLDEANNPGNHFQTNKAKTVIESRQHGFVKGKNTPH